MKSATADFVKLVATHERNWLWLAEDGQEAEEFEANPSSIYIDHDGMGYIELRKVSKHMYDIHIAMLPGATRVKEFVFECLDFAKYLGAKKINGVMAEDNKAARILAKKCGFKFEGKIKKALMRKGKMQDILVYGMIL